MVDKITFTSSDIDNLDTEKGSGVKFSLKDIDAMPLDTSYEGIKANARDYYKPEQGSFGLDLPPKQYPVEEEEDENAAFRYSGAVADAFYRDSPQGRVLSYHGQGANQNWGAGSVKDLFGKPNTVVNNEGAQTSPMKGFNETFLRPFVSQSFQKAAEESYKREHSKFYRPTFMERVKLHTGDSFSQTLTGASLNVIGQNQKETRERMLRNWGLTETADEYKKNVVDAPSLQEEAFNNASDFDDTDNVFDTIKNGAAVIIGQFAGALGSPESYATGFVGPVGRGIGMMAERIAGKFAPKARPAIQRILEAAVSQGLVNTAVDPAVQTLNITASAQDYFDVERLAMAPVFGATFGATFQATGEALAHSAGKARAKGLIGEGEEGFFRTQEPTPEELAERNQAGKDTGTDPAPPVVPKYRNIHELAREVDPETFREIDRLKGVVETLRENIPYRESIVEAEKNRVGGVLYKEVQKAEQALQEVRTQIVDTEGQLTDLIPKREDALRRTQELLDSDSAEGAAYREYAKLVDLQEDAARAYEHARSLLPEKTPQEKAAAEIKAFEKARKEKIERDSKVEEVSAMKKEISDRVTEDFIKAGVFRSEAEQLGPLVAAHYHSRAERFQGLLGTAKQLFEKDFPEVKEGKEGSEPKTSELEQRDPGKPFYSALTENVEKFPQGTALAKDWAGIIDNLKGIKKEEVLFSGVKDWLQLKQQSNQSVTKEELIGYLRAHEFELKEVVKNDRLKENPEDPLTLETIFRDEARLEQLNEMDPDMMTPEEALEHERLTLADEWIPETETQYKGYTEPGGSNYKEFLIMLPTADKTKLPEGFTVRSVMDDEGYDPRTMVKYEVLDADGEQRGIGNSEADAIKDYYSGDPKKDEFRTHHWSEPNVLAHIRFDERIGPNGEKVLHIAEIQSDWHQQGRKHGYASKGERESARIDLEDLKADVHEFRDAAYRKNGIGGGHMDFLKKHGDAQEEIFALEAHTDKIFDLAKVEARAKNPDTYVTPAPQYLDSAARQYGYKSWDDVDGKLKQAYKKREDLEALNEKVYEDVDFTEARSLLKDAQEKYEGLSEKVPDGPFKNSWQELSFKRMVRYAAEHGFDRISWDTGETQIKRYERALRKKVDKIEWEKTIDDNGKPVVHIIGRKQGYVEVNTRQGENTLSDAIGKAMADKILKDENQKGTIREGDITIDDVGPKNAYDKKIPQIASGFAKQFKGKIEDIELSTGKAPPSDKGPGFYDADDLYVEDPAQFKEVGAAEYARITMENGTYDGTISHYDSFNKLSDQEKIRVVQRLLDRQKKEDNAGRSFAVHSMTVTPEMKEAVMQSQPLFQEGRKGSLEVTEKGQQNILRIFRNSDASTAPHELGHQWLEEFMEDARNPKAPDELLADAYTVDNFLGRTKPDAPLTRKQHEKFARAWERYLREGKAPSQELKNVFEKLKAWLQQVYQSVKDLNVPLTDEMRGVFDRLLATPEELANRPKIVAEEKAVRAKKAKKAPETVSEAPTGVSPEPAPAGAKTTETASEGAPRASEEGLGEGQGPGDGSLQNIEGTGEVKTMGYAKRRAIEAIASGLEIDLKDLPQYRAMVWTDEARKAVEYVDANPDAAERAALNVEPWPEGILPEALIEALEIRAMATEDSDLIRRLAMSRRIATERKTMAQRLAYAGRKGRFDISLVDLLNDVIDSRKNSNSPAVRKEAIDIGNKLKEFTDKNVSSTGDVKSILKTIECDY